MSSTGKDLAISSTVIFRFSEIGEGLRWSFYRHMLDVAASFCCRGGTSCCAVPESVPHGVIIV